MASSSGPPRQSANRDGHFLHAVVLPPDEEAVADHHEGHGAGGVGRRLEEVPPLGLRRGVGRPPPPPAPPPPPPAAGPGAGRGRAFALARTRMLASRQEGREWKRKSNRPTRKAS